MAIHRTPQYPLNVSVFRDTAGVFARVQDTVAGMRAVDRERDPYGGEFVLGDGALIQLMYFPAGTDVRDVSDKAAPAESADRVEVPTRSGCFYSVLAVADTAKGFPNEFRIAAVQHVNTGGGPRP